MLKISVLTPCLNSGAHIHQAVLSVLEQDYPHFEHIIMDGGSTDQTLDVLAHYPHLVWRTEKDNGQSHALNKAFTLSRGELIVVLNSDDYFAPGAFQAVNAVFQSAQPVDFLVGGCTLVGENQRFIQQQNPLNCDLSLFGLLHWWWQYNHPLNPLCYFYRRQVQETCGPFNEHNHDTMDYEFLLNCARRYPFHKIPTVLGTYQFLPGTKSYNNFHQRKLDRLLMYSFKYWQYLPLDQQFLLAWDFLKRKIMRPLLLRTGFITEK